MKKKYSLPAIEILNLVSQDDISNAVEKLKIHAESRGIVEEAYLLSGRYNNLNNQLRRGLIDFREAAIETNNIRHSIVETLKKIEDLKGTNEKRLVEAEASDGFNAWWLLLVDYDKIEDFDIDFDSGKAVNFLDYGIILKSGYGEIDEEILLILKQEFGFVSKN